MVTNSDHTDHMTDHTFFQLLKNCVKEIKKIPDWVFEETSVPWIIEEGRNCDKSAGSFLG